jgi:hypothetical protein
MECTGAGDSPQLWEKFSRQAIAEASGSELGFEMLRGWAQSFGVRGVAAGHQDRVAEKYPR